MRTVTGGNGQDNTAAVAFWLSQQKQLTLATLYLIGEPEDPSAVWLTDWDTSLVYSIYGTFNRAVVTRGAVSSKVGFEVATLDVTWTPNNFNFTNDITSTSPYQQAILGKFDGATFRSWTAYMPTPGDADTFGCSELFGGRIGDCTVEQGAIKFTVNSFLDVVNQQTPGSVVETLNSIAGFKGATPPVGLTQVPTFAVVASTTQGVINAQCLTPTANQIFSVSAFQGGFLDFTSGSLVGLFSAIEASNSVVVGGTTYNQFAVYTKFPWVPQIGDQFYASATFPINQADGQYFGFPYVPDPSTAF